MEKMNVIQRLAPNYWLGYYVVYLSVLTFLLVRHRDEVTDWSGIEYIFTLAAIFTVSVGTALTSAIIAEGVGYMVLLIPKRVKHLKDEGRREGRMEGRMEGRVEGRMEERAEARERAGKAFARFERGEITFDELRRLTSGQD